MRLIPALTVAVVAAHLQAGPPQARTIAELGPRDEAPSVAVSPDGSFALLGSGSTLESVDLASGRVTTIATGEFYSLVWSANGSLVAFERDDSAGTTQIWSASTDPRTGRLASAPAQRTRGGADSPAISADGSLIAFAGNDSVGQSINIAGPDNSVRRLVKLARGGYAIGFSADGRSLFYAADRGAFRVTRPIFAVPVNGGETREIIPFNLTWRPRLSRDRTQLVFRSATDTISIADTSGRIVASFKLDSPEIGINAAAIEWSANNTLIVAERRDTREVTAFSLADGATRTVPQPGAYAIFPSVSPDGRWLASLVSVDGRLVVSVVPLRGGPAKAFRTYAPPFTQVRPLEWSPNGRFIAVLVGSAEHPAHANAVGLEFVDVESGGVISHPSAPDVRHAEWSPDSRAVRYLHVPVGLTGDDAGSQIRELSLAGVDRLVHRFTTPGGGHTTFQDYDHFHGMNRFFILDLRTGVETALDTLMRARGPASAGILRPTPSFSADGRWLASLNASNTQGDYNGIRLVDTRDRTSRTVALGFEPTNTRVGPLWFQDGSHVVIPGFGNDGQNRLHVVRLSDGSSRRLNVPGSVFGTGVSLAPDATTLIFTRQAGVSTFRLVDFDQRGRTQGGFD